jgi:hypothetical protein
MKQILEKADKALRRFLKRYPELLSIPVALILWILSIRVLRALDPTSAVFDAGVFQVPIFAILQMFVYVSVAWLLLRLVFGTAQKFLKNDFKTVFENLDPWRKVIVAYGLFLSLLFALVALSYTLR